MTKRYVTWKRKMVNENYYQDPNTNNRVSLETNGMTTFTETPYQHADGRFISVVEYPDTTTPEEIDYFINLDPAFEFTFIDETQANLLLSETYGEDVSVSNFVFTDTMPKPEF